MRIISLCLVLMFVSCVKHGETTEKFVPISTFSGRLLVMAPSHRFQVELDWFANEEKGQLRLTHALSGRVMFVQWNKQKMFWRDNAEALAWQPLSEQALVEMGIILPPWQLASIFLGQYPSTMHSKDGLIWKGKWNGKRLGVKWYKGHKRVEIKDPQHGSRAVVIMNE